VVQHEDRGSKPSATEHAELNAKEAEEKAIEAITALGGKVTRDEQSPDRPVVDVNLAGTKVTNADLQRVAAFKHLRSREFTHTQVTDDGLKHLTGLTHLTTLSLSDTKVTGEGMKYVGELKRLYSLVLFATPVGDTGMKHLSRLTELHTLVLSGTKVTDAGMA